MLELKLTYYPPAGSDAERVFLVKFIFKSEMNEDRVRDVAAELFNTLVANSDELRGELP